MNVIVYHTNHSFRSSKHEMDNTLVTAKPIILHGIRTDPVLSEEGVWPPRRPHSLHPRPFRPISDNIRSHSIRVFKTTPAIDDDEDDEDDNEDDEDHEDNVDDDVNNDHDDD